MRGVRRERPGTGQESVWDYPRPPALVPSGERVQVVLGGSIVADTRVSYRVLEISHPPTYYLPASVFGDGTLRAVDGSSHCEWKGAATYYDLVSGDITAARAAWGYPRPTAAFAALRDHVALYPGRVERCLVDGEVVRPQPGEFYGGWVTSKVVGPFKGAPGTWGW